MRIPIGLGCSVADGKACVNSSNLAIDQNMLCQVFEVIKILNARTKTLLKIVGYSPMFR